MEMAHGGKLIDRSSLSQQHSLGLFSDLNYTTIGDPYDDVGLSRMLKSRTERPGHGRYKLPVLKTAPRLPGTKEWKGGASWKAPPGPKVGNSTKEAFFGTTIWMEDAYQRKWDAESARRKMIESKVLHGNFLPPSGCKSIRTRSSKITSKPAPSFFNQ